MSPSCLLERRSENAQSEVKRGSCRELLGTQAPALLCSALLKLFTQILLRFQQDGSNSSRGGSVYRGAIYREERFPSVLPDSWHVVPAVCEPRLCCPLLWCQHSFSSAASSQARPPPHQSSLANVWGQDAHKSPLWTRRGNSLELLPCGVCPTLTRRRRRAASLRT